MQQLLEVIKGHNIFNKFQSGFRHLHSTETALLRATNDILIRTDKGKHSVLLDLTAAFKTIKHSIMVDCLNKWVGISGSALNWFSSYLSNRRLSGRHRQLHVLLHLYYVNFSMCNDMANISTLHDCMTAIKDWMSLNFLQLNPDKTEVLFFGTNNIISSLSLSIGPLATNLKPFSRNLGVISYHNLHFESHRNKLVKKQHCQRWN